MLKFGTSGLRGLVVEMSDPVCAAWTSAFIRHLAAQGGAVEAVLIGRDRRPSSERIAAACAAAIAAEGARVLDCGVLPTPALALEAQERGVPAVMVTGSHIPFDRNGLKFYRPGGEITKQDEAGIVAAFRALDDALPAAGTEPVAAEARYTERYVAFFGKGVLAGWRIGLYEHSAAGRDLMRRLLEELGATVVSFGRTDDFVPVDTEAISAEDARRIAAWVHEARLDALVSTDGDGDRPLLADETGTVLRGDALGALAARELGAVAVATPLNASTALERSGWFGRTLRTRIGSPFVIDGLDVLRREGGLVVGFEANGGFLLGGAVERDGRALGPLATRDSLLPILAVLCGAAARGEKVSAVLAQLPQRATASDRLQEIPDTVSAPMLAHLAADAAARKALAMAVTGEPVDVGPVETLDGVRMIFSNGEILHLRASGNAPELRCYAEADGQARAEALTAAGLAWVSRHLADRAA